MCKIVIRLQPTTDYNSHSTQPTIYSTTSSLEKRWKARGPEWAALNKLNHCEKVDRFIIPSQLDNHSFLFVVRNIELQFFMFRRRRKELPRIVFMRTIKFNIINNVVVLLEKPSEP